MRAIADTNLLVRAIVQDDPGQTRLATEALLAAEVVAITPVALCEFVWVASRAYRLGSGEIAAAIRTLLAARNVEADWRLVEAGLAMLDAGGDFADGVIAYDGLRLGGDIFLSFDQRAVRRLEAQGEPARLLE
ncbi:MAG: type II toxin-antitoxin system VapC family toxin [Caulobacterales bacterium]|nr:type II toxin-antitoxin system VapC family toxin [Caulobacterales bacterium]